MTASLSDLLRKMLEMSGSDLHISTNSPPQVRVHGHLQPLDMPMLTPSETKQLAYSVLTDAQKHRFEENLELDFSFGLKGLARFRGNLFNQRGATGAVFRVIPFEIKSFQQLGLPAVVTKLCEKPRGLILVTGPTGSGKSTTLAAMIDKINSERHEHIITIEDPIEFVHQNKNCLVNQRELHADTKSFSDALRAALREDPDVVLIGEMRDLVREDKIHQIYYGMQSVQDKFGMQTFNQSLATLYFQKQITLEQGIQRSSQPDELQEMIKRGAGLNTRPAAAAAVKR